MIKILILIAFIAVTNGFYISTQNSKLYSKQLFDIKFFKSFNLTRPKRWQYKRFRDNY